MTKQELEEKIKNGESVWVVSLGNVWEIKPTIKDLQILPTFKDIFKTKAEAEHYLHHANISRTETLLFLTWEEFLKKEHINFNNGKEGFSLYISYINCDHIRISTYDRYNPDGDVVFEAPLTESNFYKAYDECVRLFKQER